MSEVSTLLPVSSIGAFVQNEKLKDSIVNLSKDWRFPCVQIDVVEGDVSAAISTYESQETHDLIIIETLSIDDDFSDRLEDLSKYCTEDTAAIVVGPENDVNLYRKLMDMGISDYLVHPIKKGALGNVIAKALIERMGTAESRLVTVIGAKGGVGTSSIAQALSLISSDNLKQKTLLLDAAGGASYTCVAMGQQEPITTLKEVARASLSDDEGSMKRMLVDINDNLTILASGGEPVLDDPVELDSFDDILNRLMVSFPTVIFDASSSSLSIKKASILRSHKIYLITTPTLASLRAARMFIQEIKTLRGGDEVDDDLIHLVLNMKGHFSGQEVSKSEAEKALEHDINTIIDFDAKLFPVAEIDGKKITEVKNSEKFIKELTDGLEAFLGTGKSSGSEPASGNKSFLDGLLDKLKG